MIFNNYNILSIAFASLILSCNNPNKPNESMLESDIATVVEENKNTSSENDDKINANQNGSTISVTGFIDVPPENRATISPYYGGFVRHINVLPGQNVKKGEVLFTLQNPEYLHVQQAYLESKEQIDYLKEEYERQEILAFEKIASTKNYKKSESDYKVMLARYQSLKEQVKVMGISIANLESGKLTSTIDIVSTIQGNVTNMSITKGAFVDAQSIAVTIVNMDHIHLELDVFERDVLNIKVGQQLVFNIPESSTQDFQGKVYLVSKLIDPKKRTAQVHGHITESDNLNFVLGMFVEARIMVEE